jgi:glycosyltransferase involved in cell wall biosynthesis
MAKAASLEKEMHVHYFYQWCTMGGVERTLINRALILRRSKPDFGMTVTFLDGGPSLDLFQRALRHYGLADQVRVTEDIPTVADLIIYIDTPGAFVSRRSGAPHIVECHTTYQENQSYLKSLPDWIRAVVVPSKALAEELKRRRLVRTEPFILPNIMLPPIQQISPQQVWTRRPIAYFGRLDPWKNTQELLGLWSRLKQLRQDVFFLLAGPQSNEPETARQLEKAGILALTVRLPSVPFERIPSLLALVRAHKGLIVSCSKGESFGWTAAEAIAEGVPVLLSDNAGHDALVQGDGRFLYKLGQPAEGAGAAETILNNWDEHAAALSTLTHAVTHGEKLRSAWDRLCVHIGL